MAKINLTAIIQRHKLSPNRIAELLFPSNKLPMPALNRILSEESELSSSQAAVLAEFLNIPVSDLYEPSWRKILDAEGLLILTHLNHVAIYDEGLLTLYTDGLRAYFGTHPDANKLDIITKLNQLI